MVDLGLNGNLFLGRWLIFKINTPGKMCLQLYHLCKKFVSAMHGYWED